MSSWTGPGRTTGFRRRVIETICRTGGTCRPNRAIHGDGCTSIRNQKTRLKNLPSGCSPSNENVADDPSVLEPWVVLRYSSETPPSNQVPRQTILESVSSMILTPGVVNVRDMGETENDSPGAAAFCGSNTSFHGYMRIRVNTSVPSLADRLLMQSDVSMCSRYVTLT
jgi:hypothetical protein